jgi:hypothetical protein
VQRRRTTAASAARPGDFWHASQRPPQPLARLATVSYHCATSAPRRAPPTQPLLRLAAGRQGAGAAGPSHPSTLARNPGGKSRSLTLAARRPLRDSSLESLHQSHRSARGAAPAFPASAWLRYVFRGCDLFDHFVAARGRAGPSVLSYGRPRPWMRFVRPTRGLDVVARFADRLSHRRFVGRVAMHLVPAADNMREDSSIIPRRGLFESPPPGNRNSQSAQAANGCFHRLARLMEPPLRAE